MSTAPDVIAVNGSGGGGAQNNNQDNNSTGAGAQLPTAVRQRSPNFLHSLYHTESTKPRKGSSKDNFSLKVR